MKLDEMHKVPMYVLVAPDGTPQTSTFGQDLPECFAITKLLHKAGYGKAPNTLIREVYRIMPVLLTITQNGEVHEGFNVALGKSK